MNSAHDAQGCRDKTARLQSTATLMPGNESRHVRGDGLGYRKMFGAEGRDRILRPFANWREEKS